MSDVFGGGVPVKPDVDRLRAKFGIPAEGTVIKWEDLEDVLRMERKLPRFKTVVTAWRSALMSESNVLTVAVRGIGFQAADPDTWIQHTASLWKQGCRKLGKASRLAELVDETRLSREFVAPRTAIIDTTAKMRVIAAAGAKKLKWPDPEVKAK